MSPALGLIHLQLSLVLQTKCDWVELRNISPPCKLAPHKQIGKHGVVLPLQEGGAKRHPRAVKVRHVCEAPSQDSEGYT